MFLDSSVLYNALVETELTEYTKKVFSQKTPKITSDTAVDEVWFALTRKALGEKSAREIKKRVNASEGARKTIEDVLAKMFAFLQKYEVMLIPDSRNWAKIARIAGNYGLLPHDARLVVTAMEAGANEFATLNRDFGVVKDIIELLPKEYWEE